MKSLKLLVSLLILLVFILTIWWTWPQEPIPSAQSFELARENTITIASLECTSDAFRKLSGAQATERVKKCNDLIQQTRAADAAEQQAQMAQSSARLGFVQTVIGMFTLGAAFIAAVYSGWAATSARQALGDQRLASENVDRPWLCLHVQPCEGFSNNDQQSRSRVDIIVSNIGNRLAKNITAAIIPYQGTAPEKFEAALEVVEKRIDDSRKYADVERRNLLPGQKLSIRAPIKISLNPAAYLRAIAYVKYNLPDGREAFYWEVFQLEKKGADGITIPIRKSDTDINADDVVARSIGWTNAI